MSPVGMMGWLLSPGTHLPHLPTNIDAPNATAQHAGILAAYSVPI